MCESCPYTRVLVKDTVLRTLSQSRSPGTTNPCPEGPQLLTAFHLLLSYNPRVLISIQNLPSFSDLCFQLRLSTYHLQALYLLLHRITPTTLLPQTYSLAVMLAKTIFSLAPQQNHSSSSCF